MRTSQIIGQRQRKRARQRSGIGSKAGLSTSILISLMAVLLVFAFSLAYMDLTTGLPPVDLLPQMIEPPNGLLLQPTRIYDRTGQHLLAELAPPDASREYLELDEISISLVDATLASADPDFWTHPGYTLRGLMEGTQTTLAQRLAATLLLEDEEPGLRRSLRERILAAQITKRFGREKVLEWYLNSVSYGPLIYGAGPAAHLYFDKPASDLTLAESSALAAASQTPDISPAAAPDPVLERQRQILGDMLVQERITPEETLDASAQGVVFKAPEETPAGPADSFTALVRNQLNELYGQSRVERGGLIAITSLDMDLQEQANCTTVEQLKRMNGEVPASLPTVEDCQAAQLLPTFPAAASGISYHANLMILDPSTGQILALAADQPDIPGLSVTSLRPAGTLTTPFIYLAGFTRGLGPASLLWDIPPELLSGELTIDPAAAAGYHGPIRLRTAFANGYISPAEQVLAQIGPEIVARTAYQLGLQSLSSTSLSGKTGNSSLPGETSIQEITQAYGVFAEQGFLTGEAAGEAGSNGPLHPMVLLRVEDMLGETLRDCSDRSINCRLETRAAVSPELAYLVHHVISDDNARWQSLGHPNLLEIGRPAGALLGRVDRISGWTAGYIQDRVVVTWVGAADPSANTYTADDPIYGSLGVRASAALWRAMIQYSGRNLPAEIASNNSWAMPTGISQVEVCDPSGYLPTNLCPTTVTELFLSGNEPVQLDDLFRSYPVNRETGRLATIFTPPGLVEDRVYMNIPAFAAPWAEAAGIESAPRNYDVIYSPTANNPDGVITSPTMFAYAGGKLQINGTAAGEDFEFYRLQAGSGLIPSEWIQIGPDVRKPKEDGVLAEWDTNGLSGLYALQLLVIRQDQTIDSFIVQITIDNERPLVNILTPEPQQTFTGGPDSPVVLHAAVSDEAALSRVEFYIDNEQIASLVKEPYLLAWQASGGRHTFRARAFDMAGNWTEESIEFLVKQP